MASDSEMEVVGVDNCDENAAENEIESSSSSLRILSPPPNPYSCRKYEGSYHCVNEYIGYEPENGVTRLTERIPVDQITNEQFFEDYVLKRRPAVFSGQLTDPTWAANRWTNGYLVDNAGKTIVRVEKRHTDVNSTRGTFGVKEDMEYSKFLQELDKGNENLYMTTQDMERDEGDLDDYGMPQAVAAEPLRTLQKDFPVRPTLLGNLIPYQLSLWQGTSKHGSSSGLHHDFHDNLYILLRGRKTFRLFPPSAVGLLRPAGSVTKVHKNGLIVYAFRDKCNVVNIRADGVPLSFISRRKRDEAETELAEAEDDLLELRERENTVMLGAKVKLLEEKKRLRSIIGDCEDRIDDAIAESIRYGDVSDDEDEVISISDDDEDDMKNKTVDDDDKEPAAKQPRLDKSETPSNSSGKEQENKKESESNSAAKDLKKKDERSLNSTGNGKDKVDTNLENNFCTVKLPAVDTSDEEFTSFLAELYKNESACRTKTEAMASETTEGINVTDENKMEEKSVEIDSSAVNGDTKLSNTGGSQCSHTDSSSNQTESRKPVKSGLKGTSSKILKTPELPSTFGCIIVDLKPGEMLYLPASWFHEVTSYNDDITTNKNCSESKDGKYATVASDTAAADEQRSDDKNKESCTATSQSSSRLAENVLGKDIALEMESTSDNQTEVAAANKKAGNTNTTSLERDGSTEMDQCSSSSVHVESKSEVGKEAQQLRCMTDRGHLAFNYWMYPPDGSSFKKPYEGEFWPRRWYELETLRCTMGVGGRWGKGNDGGEKDNRRGNIKACSSHVINLDSDDSDKDLNEINDSDCFPMDKHASSGDEASDEDSWSYEEQGIQQRHRTHKQDSCILLNDTSSICEIVDEGEDSEDELNSADRGELDSSFLDDSLDNVNNSRSGNKINHSVTRHNDGQAIYVDLDSDDSYDIDEVQAGATSADNVCATNKLSFTQNTPVKDAITSDSVSHQEPAEVPLDTNISESDNKEAERVTDATAASSLNPDEDKEEQNSTSAEMPDIASQAGPAAVPDILSEVAKTLNKSDNTDNDEDKNLEKLLDENDDDNLDEVTVDDKLLDESYNGAV